MKKIVILLTSILLLSSCSPLKRINDYLNDERVITHYKSNYFFGKENEKFQLNILQTIFEQGIFYNYVMHPVKVESLYDDFILYTYNEAGFKEDLNYFVNGSFAAKVTFPSSNCELWCNLLNNKEKTKSDDLFLGCIYVENNEIFKINSIQDFYSIDKENSNYKTFILNNNLDFLNSDFNFGQIDRDNITFLNPNNYKITNLNFDYLINKELNDQLYNAGDKYMVSLFKRGSLSYFDNLIFENVTYDFNTTDKEVSYFSLFNSQYNSVFKNIKITNMNVVSDTTCIGGGALVYSSFNNVFINNQIDIKVIQSSELVDNKINYAIGGIASRDARITLNEFKTHKMDRVYRRFNVDNNIINVDIKAINYAGGLFGVVLEGTDSYDYYSNNHVNGNIESNNDNGELLFGDIISSNNYKI